MTMWRDKRRMSDRYSADLMVALTLLSAIVIMAVTLYGRPARGEVIACRERVERSGPDDRVHWGWRMIDGRRCLYVGRNGKPKHKLEWTDIDEPPRNEFKGDQLRREPSSIPDAGSAQEQKATIPPVPAAAPLSEFENRWVPMGVGK